MITLGWVLALIALGCWVRYALFRSSRAATACVVLGAAAGAIFWFNGGSF